MIDYNKLNNPQERTDYLNTVLKEINSVSDPLVLADLLKMLSIKLDNEEVNTHDAELILTAIRSRNKILLSDSYKNNMNYNSKRNYDAWERENRTESYSPFPSSDNEGGTTNSQVQSQDKKLSLSPTSVSSRRGAVSIVLIMTSIAVTTAMYTLLWIAHFTR